MIMREISCRFIAVLQLGCGEQSWLKLGILRSNITAISGVQSSIFGPRLIGISLDVFFNQPDDQLGFVLPPVSGCEDVWPTRVVGGDLDQCECGFQGL